MRRSREKWEYSTGSTSCGSTSAPQRSLPPPHPPHQLTTPLRITDVNGGNTLLRDASLQSTIRNKLYDSHSGRGEA